MTKTIEGVNLGGWLLVERWLTPSVFEGTDAIDEYSLLQEKDGTARIRKHRKEFITEEDWKWLASHSITHVRLPIGYWALNDDAPFISCRDELDWAFAMAKKFGINILLDVHGLEGSQNGTIHSGKAGSVAWKRFMPQHLATLQELARRYKDEPALWGLEIINEPSVFGNYFALLRYYRAAYALLRQELRPGTYTIFQDGFVPWLFSGTLWPRKNYPVIMDTHLYLLPSNVLNGLSPKVYDRFRSAIYKTTLYLTRIRQPLIVGEWSAILPQAQFNRTPQEQHLKLVGETIQRQREMYTPALAHFYWNYKADGRGMYNYRSLVEDSII